MELVAENGFIVSIPQGCKIELGRGSELAIYDKTVSRHQILLELQERSKEVSLAGHETSLGGLSIKNLGVNPICILHIGQSTSGRSDDQEMILLKKGEMDTLLLGDKISLSLSLPMFFTVREGEGRKNIAGFKTIERHSSAAVPMEEETLAEYSKQLAEDDLLGKWKDRKKEKETGPCITHGTACTDAFETRCISEDKDDATNEEEVGIAQAVARRQRRASERRQQQEQKLQGELPGPENEAEDVSIVQHEAQKIEDTFVKTENIDPVKEFGFLVEGSEFEHYKKHHKPDGGRWVWPSAKSPAETSSDEDDEDQQEKHTQSSKRKVKTKEDDERWRGDDQEEVVAVASAKKSKAGAKVNLRSHEPSSSKNRNTAMRDVAGGGMTKNRSEEIEDEDEDEADETLGGFIVNDEEEDPLDDEADDEREESSDDEEIDDAEEDEDAQQEHKESKRKREEKPLCKYGKKCYRKNREHLAQFQH